MMKAIVCTKYGPPEVLKLKEIEKPAAGDNEVLIKIHAVSVTVADARVRGFQVPASFWLPARIALGILSPRKKILGGVFSGEIESVGKEVKSFKKGDQVFASTSHSFGAYAEYLSLSEKDCIVHKPNNLTYEEAAAIPWGGITALYFLREGKISRGQKILIYGASGSIGLSAVQLSKYFGAEVTGVCSTANLDLVKSFGADKVIDYTKEDFTKDTDSYDIVFDAVGKSSVSGSINALKDGGVYLHSVATPATTIKIKSALRKSNKKFVGGTSQPMAKDLIFLKELVETGKLKPVIDKQYGMEQIVEAHSYIDTGRKRGDLIITVDH